MSTQAPTPAAQPWPSGTIARYLTIVDAIVDITGTSKQAHFRCTGCNYGHGMNARPEDICHQRAQAHAETCRALPRPEATQ